MRELVETGALLRKGGGLIQILFNAQDINHLSMNNEYILAL